MVLNIFVRQKNTFAMKKKRENSVVVGQDDDDGMRYKRKLPGFGGINSEVMTETNVVKKSGNISNLFLILCNYRHLVL